MRTAGIICECNPMHDGHRYLIEQAKKSGVDTVICVMSGCFTQRGEPAMLDPRTRARILLLGGADAVLELPFPYSAAGAEYFAKAGVSILDRLGVNSLWFGSECGDLDYLSRIAEISAQKSFQERYRAACADGSVGTAQAYFECLHALGAQEKPLFSNDILGISYLRALMQIGSGMEARTVKRVGSGFREDVLKKGELPSASALRKLLLDKGIEAWEEYLSQEAIALASEQIEKGCAPACWENAERAVLSHFRLMSPEWQEKVPELVGGLGRRVFRAAQEARSFEELLKLSATKKYPESRIRRGILFSMTGITEADLRREPAYAVLLAANAAGCDFLAIGRRNRKISVVTSHAKIPSSDDAIRQEFLTRQAFSLYTLCMKQPIASDAFLRCSSFIEEETTEKNTKK